MPGKRVAIVTGAGSGIGRAVAIAFARNCYSIVLIGRTESKLNETAAMCEADNGVLSLIADVTDEHAIERAFDRAVEAYGQINLLFNSAGLFGGGATFEKTTLEDWQRIIGTNLTGSFLCARAAFARMKSQSPQGGRIINCGSVSAHTPRPNTAAYTASKHAITGLTRSIALEGRAWDIACGQLDIGNATTELTKHFGSGALQADGSTREEAMMEASNVAEAAVFMANRPLEANVLFMTVMATAMPFVGRG